MTCNYYDYIEMIEEIFSGIVFSDDYLNGATEKIRRYFVNDMKIIKLVWKYR